MRDHNMEKVCFLGSHQVGKTHLFNSLCGKRYIPPYKTTVKIDFHTRCYTQTNVQYWDFPIELARYYIKDAQQIILVFAQGDHASLNDLENYVALIEKYAPNAVISLVRTENEHSNFKEEDEISENEINVFLEKHHIQYYLPIWTTNASSINTLYEHLLNLAIQPKHVTQAINVEKPSSHIRDPKARKSPDSVAISESITEKLKKTLPKRIKNINFWGKKKQLDSHLPALTKKGDKPKNTK